MVQLSLGHLRWVRARGCPSGAVDSAGRRRPHWLAGLLSGMTVAGSRTTPSRQGLPGEVDWGNQKVYRDGCHGLITVWVTLLRLPLAQTARLVTPLRIGAPLVPRQACCSVLRQLLTDGFVGQGFRRPGQEAGGLEGFELSMCHGYLLARLSRRPVMSRRPYRDSRWRRSTPQRRTQRLDTSEEHP